MISRPKKLWMCAFVAILLLLTFVGWRIVALHNRGQLHIQGFQSITVGMTQQEVEELLGGPPGDYGHNQGGATFMTLGKTIVGRAAVAEKVWCDDDHRFEIYFDVMGRVVFAGERGFHRSEPDWVTKVFKFCGL